MLSSSFRLRERLAVVLHIMRRNAAQLCQSSRQRLLENSDDIGSAKLHNVRLPYNVSLDLLNLEENVNGGAATQKHLPDHLERLGEEIIVCTL